MVRKKRVWKEGEVVRGSNEFEMSLEKKNKLEVQTRKRYIIQTNIF